LSSPSHSWRCWKCSQTRFFNVHDVNVMAEKIGLPIKKLPKDTSLHPIMGQTKTRKLLLTWLETKHNVTVLWHNIKQFFTEKMRGGQHPFQLYQQRNHFCSFYTCDSAGTNDGDSKKKEVLPLFVSVNALLFSIQYGHASFPCVLQPETIP